MTRQLLAFAIALAFWAPPIRAQVPHSADEITVPPTITQMLMALPHIVDAPWHTCLVGSVVEDLAIVETVRPTTPTGCGEGAIGSAQSWELNASGNCAETEAIRAEMLASSETVRLLVCPDGHLHAMLRAGDADVTFSRSSHPT